MRRAFTLIELLVVISIIALLIGILLPALAGANNRAKQVQCVNNLKTVMQAVHNYASDNNGYSPFANSETVETSGVNGRVWTGPGWLYQLSKVTALGRNSSSFIQDDVQTGSLWYYIGQAKPYRCPLDNEPPVTGDVRAMTSYLMNAAVRGLAGGSFPAEDFMVYAPMRLERFKSTDVSFWEPQNNWNDGCSEPNDGRTDRHLGGLSTAFFDGHVLFWSNDQFDAAATAAPPTAATPLWCDPRYAVGAYTGP